MTKWIAVLALVLIPAVGSAAISYNGSLDSGAVQTGSLETESGWAQANGNDVDFWSFSGNAGESVSFIAESESTDVAFSLFTGEPDAFSQPFFFSNDSDWDLFSLVTLSSTLGNEYLLDFILPASGMFTLAIGGEVPDFLADGTGPFGYSLQMLSQAASVPLPGAAWLMLAGLAGLVMSGKRRAS